MRILVLNYEFPPMGGGGGRIAADFCRSLASFGHEVQVHSSRYPSLPAQEVRDGYTIVRSFALRRRLHTCTVPEMAAYLVLTLAPTLKHVRTWKPDVLHVHFAVPTGVIGWIIHRLTGIPYLLSVQLGDVPGGVPEQTDHLFRWIKPLTRYIWQAAAKVTAPAEHIRRMARQQYGVPVEVIPNGVDLTTAADFPLGPSAIVRLLFVGRFNPQKNPLFLFEILSQLRDLDWQLDMVGDGPLMAAAQKLALESKLADRVHFYGWLAPEQVSEVMARGDILILPSNAEGLPLVGVQALVAGLAILGSDIGGIADVVQQGENGFLCPVNDLKSFTQKLHFMLENERYLPMRIQSRMLAKKFDLGHIAHRLEKVLQDIVISSKEIS
jgi:glycosyltransferase involved in cell wall biosynthesis